MAEHERFQPLVMVLLVRRDDEVDRVRERRVRDVVQQPGDLLAERCTELAQQDENAQRMLESRHVLERKRQRRRPGLMDSTQPLKCLAAQSDRESRDPRSQPLRIPDPATASRLNSSKSSRPARRAPVHAAAWFVAGRCVGESSSSNLRESASLQVLSFLSVPKGMVIGIVSFFKSCMRQSRRFS